MIFLFPLTLHIRKGDKMLIKILMMMSILFSANLVAYGEVIDLKGKYYEKDDCIYVVGNWTKEEKARQNMAYKERVATRTRQLEIESQQRHEIEIEEIKAQAMTDYLIAQGMPLREVAEATKNLKIRQSVNMGNFNSSSHLKIGDVSSTSATTNNNINTNETNVDVKK